MRIFAYVAALVAAISVIFKWRFRIINTLLSIRITRKFFVPFAMKIPVVRQKLLAQLFSKKTAK